MVIELVFCGLTGFRILKHGGLKRRFWLALALTFVRDSQLRMSSASIIVFEGMASNPTKTPLLRAEWHEWNTQSPHAQPHWHVYPSALADFASEVPEAFFVEPPVLEFGAPPLL
jgi:hypothetical protein